MNQIEILNRLRLNNYVKINGERYPVIAVGLFDKDTALLIDNRHITDPLPPKVEIEGIGKTYVFGLTIWGDHSIVHAVQAFNTNHVFEITDVVLVADVSPTTAETSRQLRFALEEQKATIASQEQMLEDHRGMITKLENAIAKEKALHAELDAFLATINK